MRGRSAFVAGPTVWTVMVLLWGRTVGSPSSRRTFRPAGGSPAERHGSSRSLSRTGCWSGLRTYTPSRRRTHAVMALGGWLVSSCACGSCLIAATTTTSRSRTSPTAPATRRNRMASISFWPPFRGRGGSMRPQRGSTAGREQVGLLDARRRFGSSGLCDAARSCGQGTYGTDGGAGQ